MIISKPFSAKVLLFGEYTIINGGSALAIPFNKYSGNWCLSENPSRLGDFFKFLSSIKGVSESKIEQAQIENWIFDSSIPLGYGLGSSGALTAAAYSAFFHEGHLGYEALQEKLAKIESYFHGKSSGLDPLASFLNKPIHVKKNKVEVLDTLLLPKQLVLYDSKKARVSKPLIQHYKMMLDADPRFKKQVTALSKFNDRIIDELISGVDLTKTFKELSLLQYEAFDKMIPASVKQIWKKGLEDDSYYFKLSGAGGGGFFLVLAADDQLEIEGTLELS